MPRYDVVSLVRICSCFCLVALVGCSDACSNKLKEIHISSPGRNTLKIEIDAKTSAKVDAFVRYWPNTKENLACTSAVSKNSTTHKLLLTNLRPDSEYEFQVVLSGDNCQVESKPYHFATTGFPMWMKDIFSVACPDTAALPVQFRRGYMMIYCKENPGIIYILNAAGDIVWYHQVNATGFKMANLTSRNSIISLLGTEAYPTSYGNEILEVSLTGDTLFHLRKGEKDLQQTTHHEVMLNDLDQIVAITSEDRILDLSTVGGGKKDTVKGDGIIVLDKKGKQIWKWAVFDVLDPLSVPDILKQKGDWMHANSLCTDTDGNYLLSFYNTGQIWKIDKTTGKLIWRFGKGGDFTMAENSGFGQCHALHLTADGNLMFFDNGVSKKISRSMIYHLDAKSKTSRVVLNSPLPGNLFNERMGSAYMIGDTTILSSCSKRNTVVLTTVGGRLLWALTTRFSPYRAEFISADRLAAFIKE